MFWRCYTIGGNTLVLRRILLGRRATPLVDFVQSDLQTIDGCIFFSLSYLEQIDSYFLNSSPTLLVNCWILSLYSYFSCLTCGKQPSTRTFKAGTQTTAVPPTQWKGSVFNRVLTCKGNNHISNNLNTLSFLPRSLNVTENKLNNNSTLSFYEKPSVFWWQGSQIILQDINRVMPTAVSVLRNRAFHLVCNRMVSSMSASYP